MTTATADAPATYPKYLISKRTGKPKLVPKRVRDKFECPECGATLWRGPTMWVCPNGFHGKGIPDEDLVKALEAAVQEAGYKQIKAEQIVHKRYRIQRHDIKNETNAMIQLRVRKMVEELDRLRKRANFLEKELGKKAPEEPKPRKGKKRVATNNGAAGSGPPDGEMGAGDEPAPLPDGRV